MTFVNATYLREEPTNYTYILATYFSNDIMHILKSKYKKSQNKLQQSSQTFKELLKQVVKYNNNYYGVKSLLELLDLINGEETKLKFSPLIYQELLKINNILLLEEWNWPFTRFAFVQKCLSYLRNIDDRLLQDKISDDKLREYNTLKNKNYIILQLILLNYTPLFIEILKSSRCINELDLPHIMYDQTVLESIISMLLKLPQNEIKKYFDAPNIKYKALEENKSNEQYDRFPICNVFAEDIPIISNKKKINNLCQELKEKGLPYRHIKIFKNNMIKNNLLYRTYMNIIIMKSINKIIDLCTFSQDKELLQNEIIFVRNLIKSIIIS